MEKVAVIADVQTFETRSGNRRFVIRDADGDEYTTFREGIGERAAQVEGRRARLVFHEEQRGQYRNVYLDEVEPAPGGDGGDGGDAGRETAVEEAAWRTAVDAAPWLVGESEPHEAIGPDELYEKLKPFEERVADDIEQAAAEDD